MEFMVEIDVRLPADLGADERSRLSEAETTRGTLLRETGTIARIWRVPGRHANIGIWVARDATALHAAIASLPMFPFMDVRVRPLATHPLEERPRS